jgi:hypothetical protein
VAGANQVAGDPALAAAEVERAPAGRREELEEESRWKRK